MVRLLNFSSLLIVQISCFAIILAQDFIVDDDGGDATPEDDNTTLRPPHPHQLNCKDDTSICRTVCGEPQGLPYSSTFCDSASGSCVCDCRDSPRKDCAETPFTPCFQNCVKMNPNPDVFLYKGGNCPVSKSNGTVAYQCACRCTFREDYEEGNNVLD